MNPKSGAGVTFGWVPSLHTVFCAFKHHCQPHKQFFACLGGGPAEEYKTKPSKEVPSLGGLHVVRTSPTTHSALVVIPLDTWDINLLYRTYIDWMYNLQPYFGYD